MPAAPIKNKAANKMEVDATNNVKTDIKDKKPRKRNRSKSKSAEAKTASTDPKIVKTKAAPTSTSAPAPAAPTDAKKPKKPKKKIPPIPQDPEERAAAIREQVEKYFRRGVLHCNKVLVGEMQKRPDHFARLSVVAQFTALRRLSRDVKEIFHAIKDSPMLIVKAHSAEGPLVKPKDKTLKIPDPVPIPIIEAAMESKPLDLNAFEDISSCNFAIREMINRYKEDELVTAKDSKILMQMLEETELHWQTLGSSGLKGFKVGHRMKGPHKVPCFILMRNDGTEVMFDHTKYVNYILSQRIRKYALRAKTPRRNCLIKIRCPAFNIAKEGTVKKIKDHFAKFGKVVSVTTMGDTKEGTLFIRFRSYEPVKRVLAEGAQTVEGKAVSPMPVLGPEETKYYAAMWERIAARAEKRPREENDEQAKDAPKNKRRVRRNKGQGSDTKVNDKVKQEGREAAKQKGKEQAKAVEKAKETEKEQPPSKKRKAQK